MCLTTCLCDGSRYNGGPTSSVNGKEVRRLVETDCRDSIHTFWETKRQNFRQNLYNCTQVPMTTFVKFECHTYTYAYATCRNMISNYDSLSHGPF